MGTERRFRSFEAEQAKRARQRGLLIDEAEARRLWYEELDLMAERMRADPNYREPTAEERALRLAELDRYFASLRK